MQTLRDGPRAKARPLISKDLADFMVAVFLAGLSPWRVTQQCGVEMNVVSRRDPACPLKTKAQNVRILGGSCVVIISGFISQVTIVITHIRGLITILITTHEPPSTDHAAAASSASPGLGYGFRSRGRSTCRRSMHCCVGRAKPAHVPRDSNIPF